MATDAVSDKSDKAEAPQKSKKMLVLILAGVGLVTMLGGGAYWFFVLSKPKPAPEEPKKVTSFIDLKDMIIGIQPDRTDQTDRPRMMKVKISLEVSDALEVQKVQPLLPRVEDIFQTYLRELRPADLQGTSGILYLKEELLRRVNIAVAPGRVQAILFKEIAVQ